jgi:hypothetical protein
MIVVGHPELCGSATLAMLRTADPVARPDVDLE